MPTPKYGHQNHPSTSLSSFWKRSQKLSPINNKGCGNINVEHYVSQIKYYRTSHPEQQHIILHVHVTIVDIEMN